MKFIYIYISLFSLVLPFPSRANQGDDSDTSLFERTQKRYRAVLEGVSFYYYTQNDRIQIVKELFHSLEADYSLLEIKANRFRFDLADLKSKALEAELSVADSKDESQQALSNLQFLDRARKIVADFQDSHLAARPRVRLAPVLLPFGIAKAEGKYFVVTRYPKLMEYLARTDSAFSAIELGQEVISIDGVPVDQAQAALHPYISASSPGARENEAITSLTFRDFALPERGYTIVEMRNKSGNPIKLKFPWFHRTPPRGDQNLYFKSRGFIPYEDLRLVWKEAEKKWKAESLGEDNDEQTRSLPNLMNQQKFNDAEGNLVIKTGYLLKGGKAYAVLQINSFLHPNLTDEKTGTSMEFSLLLSGFIKKIEEESIPLILDLRSNPGGNSHYPSLLFSMLTEKDRVYADISRAFRITRNILAILDELNGQVTVPEELKGLSKEQMKDLFRDAIQNRSPHTNAYSRGDIRAHEDIGGFSQKIVALTSPDCISACESFVMLLKSSRRATLLGLPTNGTGAGFWGTGSTDSSWTDSYRVLKSGFPNTLFGMPGGPAGIHVFPGQAEALNSENRPTVPDIAYQATKADLFSRSKGWINKAMEILNGSGNRD